MMCKEKNQIYLVRYKIYSIFKYEVFYDFENAKNFVKDNVLTTAEILTLPINDKFKILNENLQVCPSKNIKYIYVYNYRTDFNNGELWKQKIFSSLEKAHEYGNKYHETGYKILDYYIEIQQLDYQPKNNNIYKNQRVVK